MIKMQTYKRPRLLLSCATGALLSAVSPAMAQTVDFTLATGSVGTASVLDRGTISVTTQELTAPVLSSIVNGALEQSSSGAVGTSAVDITANALLANARGNIADTRGQLLGDAADGRIGLLTGQVASGTVTANVNDSIISAVLGSGDNATESSFAASGNQFDARATVNDARTIFADDIAANLGGLLASDTTAVATATLTRGNFNAQLVDVEGASSVVASSQVMTDTAPASTATANDNAISLDLRDSSSSSNATDSALAVDANQIRATLTGNTAVAGTDLSVDTGFGGTGVVLNQQQIGDGDDTIALTAIADSNALSINLTDETDSSVSVSQNVIGTSATGNTARDGAGSGTFLFVDANQITTNREEASVSDVTTDVLRLDGAFVAGTQQQILNSSGSMGFTTLRSTNTDSTLGVTTANVAGSVVDIARNTLFATAKGNDAATAIGLSGTSVDASAALANQQSVVDSIMATLGNNTDPSMLSATIEGTLTDASVGIDNNVLLGQAEANTARNQLSVTSDTVIAQTSPDSRAALFNPDRANAGFVLGSDQSFTDGANSIATTVDTNLLATIGTTTAVGDIDGSSVSITGNEQVAITMVNQVDNALDLTGLSVGDVGNTEAATSVVLSLQDIAAQNVTSASTIDMTLDQANYTTGAGALSIVDSSLAVDANQNRSTVTGNEAVSRMTTSADTAIVGNIGNVTRSSFVATSRATSILGNTQSATADRFDADATTNATLESNNTSNEVGIENSSLSISENLTVAESNGNIATSVLQQSAGTETGATAALRNLQDLNVGANTANAVSQLTSDTRGSVTNSSLAIDDNRIFATANGNTAQNDVIADATAITGSTVGTEYFAGFLGIDTDGATASFALASDQNQVGTTSATADIDAQLRVRFTSNSGGFLNSSAASIDNTLARANALANQTDNTVALTAAAEALNVTGAIASRQQSDGAITATAQTEGTTDKLSMTVVRGLLDASASIDQNVFVASAGANTAANRLSLKATSLTGATLASDYSTLGVTYDAAIPSVVARSDFGIVNLQETAVTGPITALADLQTIFTTTFFDLDGSSVSVGDNIAQVSGQGNEAENIVDILANASATVTSAVGNVQTNLADIDVDSVFNGSIQIATNRADANSGMDESVAALDGNIAVATAKGNIATSLVQIEASSIDGLSVSGEFAEIALPQTSTPSSRARADYTVASTQVSNGVLDAATDMRNAVQIRGDIALSSVSLSGNIGQSIAIANEALNGVVLAGSTDVSGTAAVSNEQTGTGSIAASTEVDVVMRQNQNEATGIAITSNTIATNDNLSISGARGNVATNTLALSGTSVSGRDNTTEVRVNDDGAVAGTTGVTGDNVLASDQSRTGVSTLSSSATIVANSLRDTDDGTGTDNNVDTPSTLTDSSVSISGNIADSTVGANKVSNTVALNADTKLQTSAGLVNAQSSDNSVTSDVQITARVGTDALGDITNSSVALNGNVGVARANGNEAANRMSVLSSTEVKGASTTGGSASLTTGAPTVLNALADYAMLNNQTNSGAVTAQASTAGAQTILSSATGGTLLNSSVSLSGNALVADASSNRSDNRMTLSGRAPSADVTVAVANRQVASAGVSSRVDTFRVASASGDVTGSSVRIGGNQFNASAAGNVGSMGLIRD